ncbi:unnamed protein product [Arabidopsis halleri]
MYKLLCSFKFPCLCLKCRNTRSLKRGSQVGQDKSLATQYPDLTV